MNAVNRYFAELTDAIGNGWNRFWFTPINPRVVSALRILTGVMALWYLLSFTFDLNIWFGTNGLLPVDMVGQLTSAEDGQWNGRISILYFVEESPLLVAVHVTSILVVAAFTLGIASRITNILTLLIVLSYVHRAPMITGQFEPILTLMLVYLCLMPTGYAWSVDRWFQKRNRKGAAEQDVKPDESMAAGVGIQLMKVHIAALYLMMGLTKLGGSDTWWAGEAMWWLIAHSESRLVDLTFLHNREFLINLWTMSVVAVELLFGVLIWNRLARPLLLVIAAVHWALLALVTGLLSFGAMMLVANLAFVPADVWIPRSERRP